MKHFVLFFLVSFFIVFNMDVNAKVEQSLNEYKIEQLQKGIDELKKEIDELKKDVDDTKEKKIENKVTNESLDKRVGDISGSVDRFGIIVTFLGIVITILLVLGGFIGYRNAKADAKKEAEDTTKDWIEKEGNNQLITIINKLEEEARQKIEESVKTAKDEIKQQSEAEDLYLQGRSYHLNKEYEDAEEYYNKALEAGHIGALNNLGVLYYSQNNYEKAEKYLNKALENGDNRALINFGNLFVKQGKVDDAKKYFLESIEKGNNKAFNNLGILYQKDGKFDEAEKCFLKAIEIQDSHIKALSNLTLMYTQQNEHTKLEELKQKYKI